MSDGPSTSWANWAWQAYKDGRLVDAPARATHVNETPKIEHDARDMLTPASKVGAA